MNDKFPKDLVVQDREKILKILSSTDKTLLREVVQFWASSVDVFLQDFLKAAQVLKTEEDLALRTICCMRLVSISLEMSMFFGHLEGNEHTAQALADAILSVQAMVDRYVRKLSVKAEELEN